MYHITALVAGVWIRDGSGPLKHCAEGIPTPFVEIPQYLHDGEDCDLIVERVVGKPAESCSPPQEKPRKKKVKK